MTDIQPVPATNTSAYLWWLVHKQKLSGDDIFHLTREMHDWCVDNVAGKHALGFWQNNFKWGEVSTYVEGYSFSDRIWFKYEEDLLAFKLRFGIGS